ncbi:putative Beta-1,3-N-Acetylglucosaminyltransferase family protein [Hibiscus syriacus]|uniref:Beta-1,3-N-Acetylglucosaminyltransferase family protein n=1 Tax=Hibiscus syriacus TaxID=106335 RepID=A0A6A3CZE8_HIBSY|nr:F-box/LRR-repeat protein 4-like [Hibiscus syriacus]KAE8733744.1 putative Beta-1,3-N-Acetylglucosaminyltransferase family protein [Hibiscus syriacus]
MADAVVSPVCINDTLTDDELRSILARLESDKDKEVFGLVCKKWLHLQSTERTKLSARAGSHMLNRMAARFTRVLELDLSQSVSRSFYPGVTDSDLAVLAEGFKCLKVLKLQNCKAITDKGLALIGSGLPSLQSLDASDCRKLTDKGLSAVAEGCHDLRSLHLAGCRFVTDGLLLALSRNCKNLMELGLQGCTNVTDSGLADLVDGCQQIRYLDINKCSNVGDIGVSKVAGVCSSSLKTLKLLDCYKVGDESIVCLSKFCKNLETLIIGGCRGVSDESIKSLAAACKNSLKNLRMDWCLNISDSSLRCILTQCKNLVALDIGCCEEVTDAAFESRGHGEIEFGLKVLKVSNCPKITVSGIVMLLSRCSSLEYLDVRSCPHVTKVACDEAGLIFPEFCKINFTGSLSEPDILL